MAVNPFLPQWEHVPDGEPRVFENRIYIYGSHDKSHGKEFCMEDYVCWSASVQDLNEWKYEGVIYKKEQDPMNRDRSHYMYAPDVVRGIDGRYYLYYALDTVGKIAVAVCDTPAGEYQFYGMVEDEKNVLQKYFMFDPGVLVDEGKVFLYFGFCPEDIDKEVPMLSNDEGSLVCELEADMLTIKTGPKILIPAQSKAGGTSFEGHPFFEASSIRKAGGKYYFIYSSILSHELCYAVSDRPDGGFSYGGTIISNGDIGFRGRGEEKRTAYTGNNHGSIVEVGGQWYVFYHRHTQAIRCCRQSCAEKIEFLENGTIPQAEMTSCGLNDGPLLARGIYESAICCNLVSKTGAFHIEGKEDFSSEIPYVTEQKGESWIANIGDGTQIGYKYFYFHGNENRLRVKIRGNASGTIRMFLDGGVDEYMTGHEGKLAAELPFDIRSEKWVWVTGAFRQTEGVHSIFFVYNGNGNVETAEFGIE